MTARRSWSRKAWTLAGMAFVVLVVLPGLVMCQVPDQPAGAHGQLPHCASAGRCTAICFKQSMTFYQDEFAGRIATKLMQTALAVRESVVKLIDIMNYVHGLFHRHAGAGRSVGLAAGRAARRGWLVGYVLLMRYYIPRLGQIAEDQADARSIMTGRVVDSLLQHPDGQAVFPCAPRGVLRPRRHERLPGRPVYRQMRKITGL